MNNLCSSLELRAVSHHRKSSDHGGGREGGYAYNLSHLESEEHDIA